MFWNGGKKKNQMERGKEAETGGYKEKNRKEFLYSQRVYGTNITGELLKLERTCS